LGHQGRSATGRVSAGAVLEQRKIGRKREIIKLDCDLKLHEFLAWSYIKIAESDGFELLNFLGKHITYPPTFGIVN
jgi:hypothetical protein